MDSGLVERNVHAVEVQIRGANAKLGKWVILSAESEMDTQIGCYESRVNPSGCCDLEAELAKEIINDFLCSKKKTTQESHLQFRKSTIRPYTKK